MANNCFYEMNVVSKDKSALERFIRIMNYEDEEFFIYRCFNAEAGDIMEKDGLFSVRIIGDVAWSCSQWCNSFEKENEKIVLGYENNDYSKPIYGTSHYISVDYLCKKLNIAVEVFSEESGCGFQENYIVNNQGEFLANDVEDFIEEWYDEEGNELFEPIRKGGFTYYLQFSDNKEIYA
jgi:hypothetical protein